MMVVALARPARKRARASGFGASDVILPPLVERVTRVLFLGRSLESVKRWVASTLAARKTGLDCAAV